MSDIITARKAMAYISHEQLRSDEDIFRFTGNCKYYGNELEQEFINLSLNHPKEPKFKEKWKSTQPYVNPSMIFALAKENGFALKTESRQRPVVSGDVDIYERLPSLDDNCLDYYLNRGLTAFPESARKSDYKGEESIWLPYFQVGTKQILGIHITFIHRSEKRKMVSSGAPPPAGDYA